MYLTKFAMFNTRLRDPLKFNYFHLFPRYNSEDAVGDLVAGITVGLTVRKRNG